jgi:hypothetical protein
MDSDQSSRRIDSQLQLRWIDAASDNPEILIGPHPGVGHPDAPPSTQAGRARHNQHDNLAKLQKDALVDLYALEALTKRTSSIET